jgi:hypothetical protein
MIYVVHQYVLNVLMNMADVVHCYVIVMNVVLLDVIMSTAVSVPIVYIMILVITIIAMILLQHHPLSIIIRVLFIHMTSTTSSLSILFFFRYLSFADG